MVNVNKLKGKIVEKGYSATMIADYLGMDKSTFYRKLAESGDTFTIKQAEEMSKKLDLSREEVMDIFFTINVAQNAN